MCIFKELRHFIISDQCCQYYFQQWVCKVFITYLSEHGLLPNQRYASWRMLLCTVIFQIASLYRPLPDCALGDSTTHIMLQNACEFGVLRDSDNTCQKLYTASTMSGLFSFMNIY